MRRFIIWRTITSINTDCPECQELRDETDWGYYCPECATGTEITDDDLSKFTISLQSE